MKINSKETLPDTEFVAIYKMSIEYVQELDCCQSIKNYPEEMQTLTIETHDGGSGKFIRIKTGDSGWSANDTTDFTEIINDFYKRLNCE